MKKKVWIINHYATGMLFSKGGRHYWFAKYLKREGYEPVIFSCNSKHGEKEKWIDTDKLWVGKIDDENNIPFVIVRSSLYSGNGKDRLMNMLRFYLNVKKAAKEYAVINGAPDVILASSVHPLTLVAGIQLSKHFKVKCISEVRDLWPESIFIYSSKFRKESLLGKLLYSGEKWIYRKSDALVFTMPGGADYIIEHKWDTNHNGPIDLAKVKHINNGVDLEVFDKNVSTNRFCDPDLDAKNTFKVVYAGSIRTVNKVGLLLDAAKKIDSPKVRFLIFGDGDELALLKKRVVEEKINNVIFKGRVEKKFIPSIDTRSDLNIVHWKSSPLIKYGDSSNKSFEYYASGRPILYTTKTGYSVVEKYHCGFIAEDQQPETIASCINKIIALPEDELAVLSENARKAAEQFDFKNLTKDLIQLIESV